MRSFSASIAVVLAFIFNTLVGPDAYGEVAFINSVTLILGVTVSLGVDRLLLRHVVIVRGVEYPSRALAMAKIFSQRLLLISTLVVIAVLGVAYVFLDRHLWLPLAIALPVVPLTALTRVRQGILNGMGYIRESQSPEYVFRPIFLTLVASVILVGDFQSIRTPEGVACLLSLAALCSFAYGTLLLRKRTKVGTDPDPNGPSLVRGLGWGRESILLLLFSVAWVANSQLGTILVRYLHTSFAAGTYDFLNKASEVVGFSSIAVSAMVAPKIAQSYSGQSHEKLGLLMRQARLLGLTLAVPLSLGVLGIWCLGAHWLGRDAAATFLPLAVLCVGQIIFAALGPMAILAAMTGHAAVSATAIGAASLLLVPLSYALTRNWGLLGAACAQSAALVAWSVAIFVVSRSWLPHGHKHTEPVSQSQL
jgi:O-antigen/teichoic acid export membrane protein